MAISAGRCRPPPPPSFPKASIRRSATPPERRPAPYPRTSHMQITLEQANAIIGAALAHGHSLSLKPLTVAVLDAGGGLIALQRSDGSSNLRSQVAIGKASG